MIQVSLIQWSNFYCPCLATQQTEYEFKDHSRELLFGKRNSNWCIKVNPVVSAALIIAVAIFVGYSAAEPDDANKELGNWRTWITNHFSWAYISSQVRPP